MAYTAELCMSQPAVTVQMDATLDDVVSTMEKHQIRRVPVVDELGCFAGMISQADIAWDGKENATWPSSCARSRATRGALALERVDRQTSSLACSVN